MTPIDTTAKKATGEGRVDLDLVGPAREGGADDSDQDDASDGHPPRAEPRPTGDPVHAVTAERESIRSSS